MKNAKQIYNEIEALPPQARQEVIDFIDFIGQKHFSPKKRKKKPLEQEPFMGMWESRSDMEDSSRWVRKTRKAEW